MGTPGSQKEEKERGNGEGRYSDRGEMQGACPSRNNLLGYGDFLPAQEFSGSCHSPRWARRMPVTMMPQPTA